MTKRKHKNSTQNVELQQPVAEIIIPTLILLFFAILIFYVIFNGASWFSKAEEDTTADDIWQAAFLEAEKKKVGIIFNAVSTTSEEYSKLREKCQELIDSSDTDDLDANIDVDTVVNEKQFVDGEQSQSSSSETDDLSETGPIYFNNMMMIRYMNSDGQMKVAAASFDTTKTRIISFRKADLVETLSKNGLLDNSSESKTTTKYNDEQITEEEYLNGVTSALKSMLLADTEDAIYEANTLALKYFTYEGKQTVFGNRNDINLSSDAGIKTVYAAAGKSDTSKTYKDRIYAQLELESAGETAEIYVILKLNSNMRVFDIDII
jgi:hypothetical protein